MNVHLAILQIRETGISLESHNQCGAFLYTMCVLMCKPNTLYVLYVHYIRRPLLARGHQAVGDHFNPSIPYILLVYLSTYPYILNLLFSCLVSPLPPKPEKPLRKPRGSCIPLFFKPTGLPKPCGTSFKNWPGPPKTRGRSFKSAKMSPQDGQVDSKMAQDSPKIANMTPRWPMMTPIWPQMLP
jgi:hypothetical protein